MSPDLKYVLLAADLSTNTHPPAARYSVYEVANRNIFPLSPFDNAQHPPLLQLVRWAPAAPAKPTSVGTVSVVASASVSAASNAAGAAAAAASAAASAQSQAPAQGVAFVYANDIYYKPKVQHDLVCRLTTTGQQGLVYNGVPDWLYANTPQLRDGDDADGGAGNNRADSGSETLSFSPDGAYLAFVTFNDTAVDRYEYTWLGDSWKYPQIRSIRYPKEGSRMPNVTVYVVDLSALKLIQRIRVQPPVALAAAAAMNALYVGRIEWSAAHQLSVTFMDRAQSVAVTALCSAPAFACRTAHTEAIVDEDVVLVNDRTVYSRLNVGPASLEVEAAGDFVSGGANPAKTENRSSIGTSTAFNANEFETANSGAAPSSAGFMLKRLPVRDGEHGHYRHVVFVSAGGADRRSVALTMGQFEVTALLGWDERRDLVYFMAAPFQRPGERHLYRVRVTLNVTRTPNRVFVSASRPACLTCDNGAQTFRLPKPDPQQQQHQLINETDIGSSSSNGNETLPQFQTTTAPIPDSPTIPNNCLYNRIHMSPDFGHYVQECLGPDVPSVYLVETQSRQKIAVLHGGDQLRARLATVAVPQIQTFQVEIRHGFYAQVRLLLPPGMRVNEDVAFPLILHV